MTVLPVSASRSSRLPVGIGWTAPALALAVAISHAAPEGPLPLLLTGVATAAAAAWIVVQDLATLTIPDAALLAFAAVAAAWRWSQAAALGATAGEALAAMGVDVALCGGALLVFREGYYRRRGVDGLGFGDVKLGAAGALLVGSIGFAWALFAASLAGLVAVAARRLRRGEAAACDRIAFGAVLAPALWLVWLADQAAPRLVGS